MRADGLELAMSKLYTLVYRGLELWNTRFQGLLLNVIQLAIGLHFPNACRTCACVSRVCSIYKHVCQIAN